MIVGNKTAAATAPTGTNTVELLNTFTALGGSTLDLYGIERYVANITHDQAGEIRLAKSVDGTTWDIYVAQAVAAPASPEVADYIDLPAGGYYLRVQWVNGGVNQGTWRLTQQLIERDRASSA